MPHPPTPLCGRSTDAPGSISIVSDFGRCSSPTKGGKNTERTTKLLEVGNTTNSTKNKSHRHTRRIERALSGFRSIEADTVDLISRIARQKDVHQRTRKGTRKNTHQRTVLAVCRRCFPCFARASVSWKLSPPPMVSASFMSRPSAASSLALAAACVRAPTSRRLSCRRSTKDEAHTSVVKHEVKLVLDLLFGC